MADKEKCKYWDKCYRKDAAHKNQFRHPDNSAGKADSDDKTNKSIDVREKKIFITGKPDSVNYKKIAAASTSTYGCLLETRLDAGVDYVIVGAAAGEELDEAEELGLNIVTEDEWDKILSKSPSTTAKKKSNIDLRGQRVVFTGALQHATRKQAAARAAVFGCVVAAGVSKNVDIVVAASGAGQKLDRAEELGLQILDEDEWEELLQMARPVRGYQSTSRRRNKDAAQVNDSDDEDFEPTVKKKTIPKIKKKSPKKGAHEVSESEDDSGLDDGGSASPAPAASPRKRKVHDVSGSEDESGSPPKKPANDKPKCKYWEKCYRKDPSHLKQFRHPDKEARSEDADEEDEDTDEKPLNAMADGETVDVKGGAYRIKRTGDHYYCTCMAWKNQNLPVDSRTCKHLKEHLGEKFERARCGGNTPGSASTGGRSRSAAPSAKAIPQLLLAHKWTESTNPTGWWMSEKLDGVRAYWDGKNFYSRLGNPFCPPDWFTENYPTKLELDGELFGGRGQFQSTVSIVKSSNSPRWKDVKYYVFDAPGIGNQPFEDRMEAIKKHFKDNDAKTVLVHEHTKCSGKDELTRELKRVEALGGEGLMIRQPASKYVHGRSNTLLKIKTFHDAEARVIGHEKGKGRNADRCGALRCEMESGKKFSCGSGLSDKDRLNPPKIGSIITYRFQELTNDGVPRFPSYVGVRIDMDEPKDAVLPKKNSGGDDA